MLITNFNESFIGWNDISAGKFKLSSILKINHIDGKIETFGMSEGVLACNVYQKTNLIKRPAYLFQLIGSKERQKILRTNIKPSIKNKNLEINDSIFGSLFTNFYLKVCKIKSKKINMLENPKELNNFVNIQVKINFKIIHNLKFTLEFPVNHSNYNSKNKKWHIETGPVLFPIFNSKYKLIDINPCFIAFNTLNYFEIFRDYPFGVRYKDVKKNVNTNYKINLYSF